MEGSAAHGGASYVMPIPSKSLPQVATSWQEPALPVFSALCDEAVRRCATQHGLPVTPSDEMRLRAWQLCWLALDAASAPANNLPDIADTQGWPPELVQQLCAAPTLPKLNTQTWQELRRAREQQLFAALPPQELAAVESVADEALAAQLEDALKQLGLERLRGWITPSVAALLTSWLSASLLAIDSLALSDDHTDATALELIVFVQATLQRVHGSVVPAADVVQAPERAEPPKPVVREEPAAALAPAHAARPAAAAASSVQEPSAAAAASSMQQPAARPAVAAASSMQEPSAVAASSMQQPAMRSAVAAASSTQEPAAAAAASSMQQPAARPAVAAASSTQEPAARPAVAAAPSTQEPAAVAAASSVQQPAMRSAVAAASSMQEPAVRSAAAAASSMQEPSAAAAASSVQEPSVPLAGAAAQSVHGPAAAVEMPPSTTEEDTFRATVPRRSQRRAVALIASGVAVAAVLLFMLKPRDVAAPSDAPPPTKQAIPTAAPAQPEPPVVEPAPILKADEPAQTHLKQPAVAANQRPRFRNVSAAKRALAAKKIDDSAYAAAITELEALRTTKIAKAQLELDSGKLSQAAYQRKVDTINKSLGFDRR